MPRTFAALFLSLVVLAGCGSPSQPTSLAGALQSIDSHLLVQRGGLQFVADSQTGLAIARQQRLPCLLFFTAEWCTFCHQMEETTFVDPVVGNLAEQFVCVLIDADREAQVCQQFGVRGYPTILFLSADGRPLQKLVGRQPVTKLVAGMQAALERVAWLGDGKVEPKQR